MYTRGRLERTHRERGGGGGRGEGVCCTFRPFGPFSDHFKSKNLLLNVLVLFFSVFVFREPFRDGFADKKLTFWMFLCCFSLFFRSLASSFLLF